MSNNFTVDSTNQEFTSELKKLDAEGVTALSFSELKYIHNMFSSMGFYQIDGHKATNLARVMCKNIVNVQV